MLGNYLGSNLVTRLSWKFRILAVLVNRLNVDCGTLWFFPWSISSRQHTPVHRISGGIPLPSSPSFPSPYASILLGFAVHTTLRALVRAQRHYLLLGTSHRTRTPRCHRSGEPELLSVGTELANINGQHVGGPATIVRIEVFWTGSSRSSLRL